MNFKSSLHFYFYFFFLAAITFSTAYGLQLLAICHRHHNRNFNRSNFDAEEAFSTLKRLPNDCFTYQADNYIYEYCHLESARQLGLHAVNNQRPEYSLGSYSPIHSIQKYSPALGMAKISLVGGDLCAETGSERKTKVKFFCADPKLSMHIVNAREKSTCNYRILVHVPELCKQ